MSLFGGKDMPKYEHITEYFNKTNEIILYINGEQTSYQTTSNIFSEVTDKLNTICIEAKEMPAFGVALDHETREALKEGVWVELIYSQTHEYNEMPFDSLLISINRDYTGFNIIRKQNGLYDGRCFYLNLEQNMAILYDFILSI